MTAILPASGGRVVELHKRELKVRQSRSMVDAFRFLSGLQVLHARSRQHTCA